MLLKYLAQNREQRDWPVVGSLCPVGRLRYRYYIRVFPFVWDYSIHNRVIEESLREGAMTDVVDFSILAAIPSGPDALLVSKACSNNYSNISSSEQRSSGGHRSGCNHIWSISEVSSGGSKAIGEKLVQH